MELCKNNGCEKPDQLEEIERASKEKQDLQHKFHELENQLMDIGGGVSIDGLVHKMSEIDPDTLPGEIQELEQSLEALKEQRDNLIGDIRSEQDTLKKMDGSGNAANAAELAASILSDIHNHAEQYIRLRLASDILRQEIDAYREKYQDPILNLAGKYFAAISLGSFTGLMVGLNEKDEPVLMGVRPSGDKIHITGFSDGSRDQLYLPFVKFCCRVFPVAPGCFQVPG